MAEKDAGKKAASMEAVIRKYFDGCNEANREKIMACFVPDAVHYFPPGMYDGPFRGAAKIADKWLEAVAKLGSYWTVDHVIVDAPTDRAVIEWTHFRTKMGTVLRGDEWYRFDAASGLIQEIRAYYASPLDPKLSRLELGGFDYESRGYPLAAPDPLRRGSS